MKPKLGQASWLRQYPVLDPDKPKQKKMKTTAVARKLRKALHNRELLDDARALGDQLTEVWE